MYEIDLNHSAIYLVAGFLAIFSLVVLIMGRLFQEDSRVKLRVEEILDDAEHSPTSLKLTTNVLAPADPFQFLKPAHSRRSSLFTKIDHILVRGGLHSPQRKTIAIIATVSISLLLTGLTWWLLWQRQFSPSVMLLSTAGAFLFLPLAAFHWLHRKYQRHQLRMVNSLSDFMDLIVVCLESGLSLDGAMRRVTQELEVAHPVLAVEMKQVQKEIELGTTLENAFYNLARRTGLEVISTMACFIEQSRKYGTSISDALREHSDMLRTKRETRAETLAQQASVKILLPTLLLIFPATFVVLAGPAVMEVSSAFENSSGKGSFGK